MKKTFEGKMEEVQTIRKTLPAAAESVVRSLYRSNILKESNSTVAYRILTGLGFKYAEE
jgi:hypothetical protein